MPRAKKGPITPELLEKIRAEISAGRYPGTIARKYNVRKEAVRQLAKNIKRTAPSQAPEPEKGAGPAAAPPPPAVPPPAPAHEAGPLPPPAPADAGAAGKTVEDVLREQGIPLDGSGSAEAAGGDKVKVDATRIDPAAGISGIDADGLVDVLEMAKAGHLWFQAQRHSVEIDEDLARRMQFSTGQRRGLRMFAPQVVPYVKALIDNKPMIGAGLFLGIFAVILVTDEKAVRARAPARPAPEPEEEAPAPAAPGVVQVEHA